MGDVLGWVWTTVRDAPGIGYFSHKGVVNKNWQTFNAIMEKNHYAVQIKVTLHSDSDLHERHIVDNMEVYGSECIDWIAAVKPHHVDVTYTCRDKAGHNAMNVKRRVTIVDRTPPTIKI